MIRVKKSVVTVIVCIGAIAAVSVGGCGKAPSKKKSSGHATIKDPSKDYALAASGGSLVVAGGSLDKGSVVALKETDALDDADTYGAATGALNYSGSKDGDALTDTRDAAKLTSKITSTSLLANSLDNLCFIGRPTYDPTRRLVWRRDAISLNDAKTEATITTRYFGKYQAVYCGTASLTNEVEQVSYHAIYAAAQGTWKRACANYDAGSFVLSGLGFTETSNHYSLATCTSASRSTTLRVVGDLDTEGSNANLTGAKNIRYRIRSVQYTIVDAQYVTMFNYEQICGKTDWAVNTAVELLNTTCGEIFDRPVRTNERQWYYDLLSVSGSQLTFGESSGTYNGTTSALRPVALDGTRVFTK